jgi:3-hydroxyisobutyrate dehydrogenase
VLSRHSKLIQFIAPFEVAQKASTIITMVPTGQHVREVYLGKDSVMSALKTLEPSQIAQTLCLDQSTIEQSVSKFVALSMREVGADMMDAPVSGGMCKTHNLMGSDA